MRVRFKTLEVRSCLPAEGDMIIEIDEVKPGLNILTVFRELSNVFGKELERFDIAAWTPAIHETAPLIDLPGGAFLLRIGVDPCEDFAIAFAGRELFTQGGEIEAEELLEMLIDWRVVGKLAIRPGDRRPAFIKQPRQSDVPTETAARAARRSFREIRCGDS